MGEILSESGEHLPQSLLSRSDELATECKIKFGLLLQKYRGTVPLSLGKHVCTFRTVVDLSEFAQHSQISTEEVLASVNVLLREHLS